MKSKTWDPAPNDVGRDSSSRGPMQVERPTSPLTLVKLHYLDS